MAVWVQVAELAERLAGESSRLKKRTALAERIGAVEREDSGGPDSGRIALYLAGLPFAEADPRRLNAGGALLTKALLAVSGASEAALSAAYRRWGDLGAAAFELLDQAMLDQASVDRALPDQALLDRPLLGQPSGIAGASVGLTVAAVAEGFAAIAMARSTPRSTAARLAQVEGMLRQASPLEGKYLLKLMLGDMRIGVKQSLVEEAIAVAAGVEVAAVRHAVMLEADLAGAVRRAFDGTLGEARMRLFHPLGFMLASPVATPEEAVERFSAKPARTKWKRAGKTDADAGPVDAEVEPEVHAEVRVEARSVAALLEDKYDGIRAQVHCGDPEQVGRVAIYSRSREDVTESFPELAEAFAGVREPLILDGEILGWDFAASDAGVANTAETEVAARALPFAVLGQRIGRKRVSNELRRAVPVVLMVFDLLYAEDGLLLDLPLRERRNRLEAVVERLAAQTVAPLEAPTGAAATPQGVLFAEAATAGLPRFLLSPSRLVERAEEIDRAYAEARARANEGVMLKAAESVYQPGRRGLAWAKLKRELATLDVVVTGAEFGHGRRAGILSDYTFAVRSAEGELLNVGKAYSGLTDVEIATMSAWMMDHTLDDQGHFRTVEPLMVLEVAFNNVMRSERHASGFALRFPRILRVRTDKVVDEIDTVARVEEVYRSQVDRPQE